MKLCYAVISSGRAHNVPLMQKFLPENVAWFVGKGERDYYELEGATRVIESGGLMRARNDAIGSAQEQGAWSVQLSDDLYKLENADSAEPLTVRGAAKTIVAAAVTHGSHYAGVAPTSNKFFYNPKRPVSEHLFIVGDFIAISPETHLRFDEALRLKEDYDYTLQHLREYGRVCRCNFILASFRHRSNKGGAVRYRTTETEQETIAYLKNKWGDLIIDNAKRPNEILMKWREPVHDRH